ncbi:MAG: DUF445 family protein [Lentisphaeria bacterium]|nr:DUF445 family protein [Lentisphaeria bacterium]
MEFIKSLLSEGASRWNVVRSPDSTREQRLFALLEILCFPVSLGTILLLLVQAGLCAAGRGDLIPAWWLRYGSPVLLAGAVGYLTNFLAITMLFRPYEPKKWLFFWPQGMIPRNKPGIARKMGEAVGNKLLTPELLSNTISDKLMAFLKDPAIIDRIRRGIQDFLLRHQSTVVDFLIPEIEQSLVGAIDELVTPERLREFWERELQPRLESGENRARIASAIVNFGKENAGDLTELIRRKLRAHLNAELEKSVLLAPLSGFITDLVMAFFASPETMREMIQSWLGEEETQRMLCSKLTVLTEGFSSWLKSQEGAEKLGSFSAESRGALKKFLFTYLHESLPLFARNALASEKLWQWFEEKMLPAAREGLIGFIVENKEELMKNLELDKQIEKSINEQNVREFHELINSIAAQHLGAIQVLGFVLGILVGLLQLIQNLRP